MPTIEDVWTPSDSLLAADTIALEHVRNPHPRSAAIEVLDLPDVVDDEVNDAAAAAALAELEDDDASGGEEGRFDDDDEVDPDDPGGDLDPSV